MKKLIAIAALAACLPAFSGQVASSNTVGYQKLTLGTGYNWIAPQFLTVGGQPININNMKLVFAEGVEVSGGDNIQILDDGGAMIDTYSWFPADWFGGTEDGWVNSDGEPVDDVTFTPGMSFLLDVVDEGTTIVINGEVATEDYVTTAVQGYNFVGNSTPSTINLQEMTLTFAEGVEVSGGDNIQILDDGGAMIDTYSWFPADWFGGTEDAWVNSDGEFVDNVTFAPGQGFLIDIVDAGTVITVPSAL